MAFARQLALSKRLRWTDPNWNLIPTGAEAAVVQRELAERESQRAERESQSAAAVQRENQRLMNLLRQHGIDP